uniref:CX domain-containing protein n=2 Tax=Caenorhabditis tropicalis TaxID=1561998 RepID=A0A1I7UKE9_9PELO
MKIGDSLLIVRFMNIFFFISLFFIFFYYEISAKGGGGRGGGGRGSSGSRSSSKSSSGSRSSGGIGGARSSNREMWDSLDINRDAFKPSMFKSHFSVGTTANTFIINKPELPIIHNNHHYFWFGYYRNVSDKNKLCEHTIDENDGELFNVTFANGTRPKIIQFGCGGYDICCDMRCCGPIANLIGSILWLLAVIIAIRYGCCRG